jgi:hypothetical protein
LAIGTDWFILPNCKKQNNIVDVENFSEVPSESSEMQIRFSEVDFAARS